MNLTKGMKAQVHNTIMRKTTLQFGRDDIIDMLRFCGYEVNRECKVFVPVPGGGDWSNTNLEIEEVADIEPVLLTVVSETVETTDD